MLVTTADFDRAPSCWLVTSSILIKGDLSNMFKKLQVIKEDDFNCQNYHWLMLGHSTGNCAVWDVSKCKNHVCYCKNWRFNLIFTFHRSIFITTLYWKEIDMYINNHHCCIIMRTLHACKQQIFNAHSMCKVPSD